MKTRKRSKKEQRKAGEREREGIEDYTYQGTEKKVTEDRQEHE